MSADRVRRLTLAEERRVDALCERFEAAIAAGETPAVDGLLEEVELSLRPRLREELEALQKELIAAPPRPPLPGRRLGGYRIVRKIGEGGMGSVFEAVQETTRRRVALKVVRSDLGSEKVRRRFEREAQLLGHLHHPGIAQIFDAGVDEHADPSRPTPFLVMELLRGLPLIEHAETHRLGTRERLELVRRVCGAVQHAHDQGIVHRDLKPANIMVVDAGSGSGAESTRDESGPWLQGSPKVLDFGVARVLEKDFAATLETQTGQIVGTVAYMSPEQLSGESGQVDGRADVYALGVILYQLLAGRLPHDLSGRNLPSAIDLLRTVDPEPLGAVDPRLRGDIEIIVGKALEKRVDARYRTAAALAADLQRHLDDVPIDARPPDTMDRLRKFARRNRGLFAGVVTAGCALLVTLIVVSVFAYQQTRLREIAESARADASEREKIAAAVSEFLNDMLRAGDVTRGGVAAETTLREVLLAAAETAEGSFEDHPPSRAAVHMALGASFLAQAEFPLAERQFRAALRIRREHYPATSSDVAHAKNSLAQSLEEQGRLDEAERHYRAALEVRRELATGPFEVVESRDDALRQLLAVTINLAGLEERRGNYEEALQLHSEGRAMIEQVDGVESAQYAQHLNFVASIHQQLSRFERAESLYRECIAIRRRVLPTPHPFLANALHNLGGLYYAIGRTDDAEPLFREALAMRLELFDESHPGVAGSRAALAGVLFQNGQFEAALAVHRAAHAAMADRIGEHHPDTLMVAVNVGFSLNRLGRHEEWRALMADVAPRLEQHYGPSHQTSLWAMSQLARAEAAVGNLDRAVAIHRRTVGRSTEALGDHARTAISLLGLAEAEAELGNDTASLAALDEALRIMAGIYERGSLRVVRTHLSRASKLVRLERVDDALAALADNEPYVQGLGAEGDELRARTAALRASLVELRK